MKRVFIIIFIISVSVLLFSTLIISKEKGDKCLNQAECDFGLECHEGVCVKKKEFDYGSSGKTGKPCNIDADCIGSGKCEEGKFGKKYCSGN
jgi:hypothetical protein